MSPSGIHFLDAQGPDGVRLYAIGDVHGRLDLLRAMHETIRKEIARDAVADWRIIHLGDYVDRGPDSSGVIDFLISASQADARILALAGNHDIGLLEFLAAPDPAGLFAHNGGRQTAQSYGVEMDFDDPVAFAKACSELRRAVPEAHRTFVQSLPLSARFGDFFFCHAGIRPGIELERQETHDLIWIRELFLNYPGLHPKIIVHGHTPAPEAEVMANRVNVDTGAFRSGRLTALVVDGMEKRILSAAE